MKPVCALAALFMLCSVQARADGAAPGAMHRHRHHVHAQHWYKERFPGALPGVLGMEIGGPVYWRPGVPRLPDVVYDIVGLEDPAARHGGVVRARY
jgi:hypothetical protein